MIGTGHHIRIRMWNGDEIVQDGLLEPGADIHLRFTDGAQLVTHFSLERLTAADVEATWPAEHKPLKVFS